MEVSQGLVLSTVITAFFVGVASFASPCILPLIPSYVSYITGISFDELVDRRSRKKNLTITLFHSLAFVAGFSIVAAARGLAVDGHEIGLVRPAFGHPRRKAGREQVWIDPIHHCAQPIDAGDAEVKLREATQERQVRFAPIDNVVVVVATRNRSAHDQKQNFAQGIRDLPRLPRILDRRKVIEQETQPWPD